MPTIPNVRPRVLNQRLTLFGLGALLAAAVVSLVSMPAAKADGVLSTAEAVYVDRYHSAICGTLDIYPTEAGVVGVLSGVLDDGFDGDSAADVMNAAVSLYCPSHWQLLVDVGNRARGTSASEVFAA